MTIILEAEDDFSNYKQLEYSVPFQGYRRYVAFAYMGVNAVGFAVNFWVLYTVAPLLFSATIKVPKSILFYIMTLCISDLMIMIGMLFLIIEIVVGTWKFSTFSCVAYLVFEAMNKFVAPVIVVLISRTCYVTVCLDPKSQQMAASLKYAAAQVIASMALVMIMLWPLFAYSQVSSLYFNVNVTLGTVNVLRKCTFMPPSEIELGFGIISCIASYAIPLGGMIYWYVSVPFFLRKRAGNSLVCSKWRPDSLRKKLPSTSLLKRSDVKRQPQLENTSAENSSNAAPLRRLIATVLVLTAVYVLCWSPYWLSIFAHKFISGMSRAVVIASYFIHLLPYISCSAYPVIFTLMNRRIKTARAQMHLNYKRRKFSFTDSSHGTERCPSRTSLSTLKNLRERVQFLPAFAHHSMTDLDSKNRNDLTNRYIGKDTESSTCGSVKSLNTLHLTDCGLTLSPNTQLFQVPQAFEVIEMQEGDLLL